MVAFSIVFGVAGLCGAIVVIAEDTSTVKFDKVNVAISGDDSNNGGPADTTPKLTAPPPSAAGNSGGSGSPDLDKFPNLPGIPDRYALPNDWIQHNQLHHQILGSYNRNIRPVMNNLTKTVVKFQLHITHLEEVNEQMQTITVNGWFFLKWKDEKIGWNDSDVSETRLPQFYLWTPDLHLINNANARESNILGWNSWLSVKRDGSVIYDPVTKFTATCDFNYKSWPWDHQNCSLFFGSWVYRQQEIEFQENHFSSKQSIGSVVYWTSYRMYGSSWRITAAPASNLSLQFPSEMYGEHATWSYIWVNLKLERSPGHIVTFLIIPLIVSSGVTLMSFWVKGQMKLWFGLVNLMMEMIQAINVLSLVPPAMKEEPTFVYIFKLTMVLTLMAMLEAVASLSIARRSSDHPPPHWLIKFVDSRVIRWMSCTCDASFESDYGAQLLDNMQGVEFNISPPANERKLSIDWLKIASLVDYLCFILFTIITAVALCDLVA